jgi:hypothetical protein
MAMRTARRRACALAGSALFERKWVNFFERPGARAANTVAVTKTLLTPSTPEKDESRKPSSSAMKEVVFWCYLN